MPLYIPALIIVIVFFTVCQSTQLIAYKKYKTQLLVLLLVPLVHHISPQFSNLYIGYQFNTVRINFKLCCITHRALSLKEPYYLNSLLINRLNSHSLRSSSFNPLTLLFFNKKSNGFRSFAHAAPFLWNHLPNTVRSAPTYLSFRKSLKTYFFLIKHFPHRLSSLY